MLENIKEGKEMEQDPKLAAFREALYKLLGEPTHKDKLDTIATDLLHVSEDVDSLRQSMENLENDLLALWKS